MAVRILTDSTADFSAREAKALELTVIPLNVNFGPDEIYRDGVDLSPQQFYRKLGEASTLPTTSQPSPELFAAAFAQARAAGDQVVAVLLSGALSGTMQSARLGAQLAGYEDGVFLIDSRTVTLGEKLLVEQAVRMRDCGMQAEEIAQELNRLRDQVRIYAVVDTLKYLHKGGRLSGAAAVAGSLMGIKPVITVQGGKVGLAGKARGLAGAYVTIFKLISAGSGGLDTRYPFMLGYTGQRQAIEPFYRYVTEKMHLPEPPVSMIGSVIGTHAGPGACGIAFFAAPTGDEEETADRPTAPMQAKP